MPLSFAPGEAYQFDWSHEIVVLSGAAAVVKVAHIRLCHSRMLFVRAYPREPLDRAVITLAPPFAQHRRIDPLPAQDGADRAGLAAGGRFVGRGQDAQLLLSRKRAPPRPRSGFRVRGSHSRHHG